MAMRVEQVVDGLGNRALWQTGAFIGGEFVAAEGGRTFPVMEPFGGAKVADVADCGAAETRAAIEAAEGAFGEWRALTGGERGRLLRRWFELQMASQEDLARILTLEQGKPLAEARGEIAYGASFVEWFAEEARRVYGDTIPGHMRDKRIVVVRQPVGVSAAITPWNFPNAMITRKVAPALAAGCPVVVKPSELTPLSATALAWLAREAGFPPGVFQVVTTSRAAEVGAELATHPAVRKLSFTGSTAVGRLLAAQCAGTVKKLSLELGGNAPFLVFEDADVDAAVEGAIAAKYRNAGQTCVCANRIFVHERIAGAFTAKLAEAVAGLKAGGGFEEGVVIGPLIGEAAVCKVEEILADAVGKGARVLTGGRRIPGAPGGLLFEPTVVEGATPAMRVFSDEIFGPIAPVFTFSSDEEAIRLANDTPFGLAAYFYGRDVARVWRVAEALDYGMVGINTGMVSTTVAPFGGIKQSGYGREGSRYGMDEYTVMKYLCWQV